MDSIAIIIFIVYGAFLVVCAMKGKWWFVLLSIFVPLFFIAIAIGAFRLAKPTSFWARRFYDREKLDRSVQRFLSEEEYAEFRDRTGAATQGRNIEAPADKEGAEYGRIGASKEEIGELAPPLD